MSDARMPTPETLEVKRRGRHRLIGAITLAVLAVVIIPMVLDSEPRKVSKDLPLTIPPKEGLPPLAPPAPEAAKPAQDAAKAAATDATATPVSPTEQASAGKAADSSALKADATPAKVVEAGNADKPVEKPTKTAKVVETKAPAKAEKVVDKAADKAADKAPNKAAEKAPNKPAEKAAEKSAPKAEGFAIQLGAFSDAEKLAALKAKMKAAKVPVFTEDVKTAGGSLTRLRAGPYKTREQADKALAQVKKAGVDGKVVPLP